MHSKRAKRAKVEGIHEQGNGVVGTVVRSTLTRERMRRRGSGSKWARVGVGGEIFADRSLLRATFSFWALPCLALPCLAPKKHHSNTVEVASLSGLLLSCSLGCGLNYWACFMSLHNLHPGRGRWMLSPAGALAGI